MGYLKLVVLNFALAVEQHVKIDRARPPALAPFAFVHPFNLQAEFQQLVRTEACSQGSYGIQEIRLVKLAPWRRPIEGRNGFHSYIVASVERLDGALHRRGRVSHIATEPEKSEGRETISQGNLHQHVSPAWSFCSSPAKHLYGTFLSVCVCKGHAAMSRMELS